MHGARVPHDQITRFGVDLDEFAAAAGEPLHVRGGEAIPVQLAGRIGRFGLQGMLPEELLEELRTALENLETTVLGPSVG